MSKHPVLSTTPVKRVAIYCREKKHLLEDLVSLSEIEKCEQRVLSNPSYKLIYSFSENAMPNVEFSKRPELKKLLTACKNGEIDLIISPSISKITRSTSDFCNFVSRIKKLNVEILLEKERLHSKDESFDLILCIVEATSTVLRE